MSMSTRRLSEGVILHDSAQHGSTIGPEQEVLRIESLSGEEVLSELQNVMEGRHYSWHSINELLQAELDMGTLDFTFEGGDVLFEWNNLCDEKQKWERTRSLSHNCTELNRDLLINLKIMPAVAGLGSERSQLVTANRDRPNLSTEDLWVVPKDWDLEGSTDHENIEDTAGDDDDLSWKLEEDDDEGDEYEDLEFYDTEETSD